MKTKSILAALVFAATIAPEISCAQSSPAPVAEEKANVQIAILLDTSSSMDGLISQAKTQLWKIVNEFITAKQNGKAPVVEVALYQYGNDGLSAKENWIQRIQPLTRDLDKISEELFKLTTNGGQEYCGAVVEHGTKHLDWNPSPDVYKAIFIAGNEPFTQGPVKPSGACKAAVSKGIIVNTIHCGQESEGLNTGWKDGALVADGKFLNIDQNKAIAHIDTPQDKKLAELSGKLNSTYLWYGSARAVKAANQVAQDKNAASAAPAAVAQRAATKASGLYKQAADDLVDAVKDGKKKLSEVKESEMPEELKALPAEKREEYVKTKSAEREQVQKEIRELSAERDAYVREEMKKKASAPGADTFDTALVKAIREQASKKSISWEK